MTVEISDMDLLLGSVADDRKAAFVAYVQDMVDNDETMGIDFDFLGFISDYVGFASILNRNVSVHGPFTVYDVGACSCLQHVLFDDRIEYVAIDTSFPKNLQFFRLNCRTIKGPWHEVVKTLKIHHDDVGIANMSLLYTYLPGQEQFDSAFRRKIIL